LNNKFGILGVRGDRVFTVGKELLEERLPDEFKRQQGVSCGLLFLGILLERSVFFKTEWVPISKDFVTEVFGDSVRRWIKKALISAGAIEEEKNWKYSPRGNSTKRYRLSKEFKKLRPESYSLPPRISRRYQSQRKASQIKAINHSKIHQLLWTDLQQITLHPDYEKGIPEFADDAYYRELAWWRSIEDIQNRNFYLSHRDIDKSVSRVYTTFSGSPKALRQYVLINGEPLIGVDVKCCQPFLHGTLLPDCDEKKRYMASVMAGTFYEDIERASKIKFDSREELKKAVFRQIFYGRTRSPKTLPLWGAFSQLYPMLAAEITRIKREDHARLSIKMQSLEASLVVHDAVLGIKFHQPEIPILTVHDAVYTTKENVLMVKYSLIAALECFTGCAPKVTIEESKVTSFFSEDTGG
jgi:hypothetical protein